jgi:hypothetical protein
VANIEVEDEIISGGVIKEFNLSFYRIAHRLSVKLCGQPPWQEVGNFYTINLLAGLRSAIVDNVPPIAAIMRMYLLNTL